jgi:hypothetical protein
MRLGWFRCWKPGSASSLLNEPPYAEPHVRWCERAAGVTPPTRCALSKFPGLALAGLKPASPERLAEILREFTGGSEQLTCAGAGLETEVRELVDRRSVAR